MSDAELLLAWIPVEMFTIANGGRGWLVVTSLRVMRIGETDGLLEEAPVARVESAKSHRMWWGLLRISFQLADGRVLEGFSDVPLKAAESLLGAVSA